MQSFDLANEVLNRLLELENSKIKRFVRNLDEPFEKAQSSRVMSSGKMDSEEVYSPIIRSQDS